MTLIRLTELALGDVIADPRRDGRAGELLAFGEVTLSTRTMMLTLRDPATRVLYAAHYGLDEDLTVINLAEPKTARRS
jgi:hypothetical protein